MPDNSQPERISPIARYIRNIALALLLLMPLAALGSRFGLWPYTVGLLLLVASMLGSLVIQLINAIWLLRRPAAGTKSLLRQASLLALPPLVLIASLVKGAQEGQPAIHNISTDTVNPPQFVAAVEQRGDTSNPLDYDDELADIQSQAYPDVTTLNSSLKPANAFLKAEAVAQQLGWEIYARTPEQGRLEAVDTTFWFGFKDDIVIRIEAEGAGSRIDLRSVSRVGKGDLGANAKRILRFTEQFTALVE